MPDDGAMDDIMRNLGPLSSELTSQVRRNVGGIYDRNMIISKTNPGHYRKGAIEPWDFIVSQNLNFLAGNVVKYISRYKHKNGVEDLKKAKTYLEKLISIEEPSK